MAEAVQSALGQIHSNLEVIVTDNCSTDGTEEICRSFAAEDERVVYHRNPENLGIVGNFDRCLKLSSGTYFKWLAADDVVDSTFSQRAAAVLDERPDVVIATSRMPFIDTGGTVIAPDADGVVRAEYGDSYRWIDFPESLSDPSPATRYRIVIMEGMSNLYSELFYGLHRAVPLKELSPHGSHLGAEKAFLGRLLILGTAYQIPDDLLFRRLHERHFGGQNREDTIRGMDPKQRVNLLKSPIDQFRGYFDAVRESTLTGAERRRAYGAVFRKTFNLGVLRRLVEPGPANYLGLGGRH